MFSNKEVKKNRNIFLFLFFFPFFRGQLWFIHNRRPDRVKQDLKDLEEILTEHTIIFVTWRSTSHLQIITHNFIIVNIELNRFGDIVRINYDKYLVGRLSDHRPTSVSFTPNYLIISSLEPRLAVFTFTKPLQFHPRHSIGRGEPRQANLDLVGPQGRRLDRQVEVNETDGLLVVWWSLGDQQVYPWSPHLKVNTNIGTTYDFFIFMHQVK